MGQRATNSDERFAASIDGLASVIGHADRVGPLRDYCVGLMMPADRKSVEPMAALTAPARVAAQHQSLLHFVGNGCWSDDTVLAKLREMVLPKIEQNGAIEAWIIDDTGMSKQGRHSVGVARQYCGQLGKQDNCQVAVSLSVANAHASLPVAYRLYLPQDWADDDVRRRKAGVPDEVEFMTKPQIALAQIRAAYAAGLPNTLAWKPGTQLEPDATAPKKGRRDDDNIVSLKEIALALPAKAWHRIEWREGTCDALASRFARVRIRVAHRHATRTARADEWLLVEWPKEEKEPTKYWLSTLPEDIDFAKLVDTAKLRWRIAQTARLRHDERDYQELKQEVGLDH
jgi:SRSO17 transposase